MKDNLTVEKLRKLGWKIKISHLRNLNQSARHNQDMHCFPMFKIKQWPIDISSAITRGGETTIEATPPGFNPNIIFIGRAVCSCRDTYNRKEGVRLALTRALNNFEEAIKERQ